MKKKKESLLQYIPRQLSWQSGALLMRRSQVRDLFGEPFIYSLSSVGQSDTLIRYRSMVRFHQRVPLNNLATKLVKEIARTMLQQPILSSVAKYFQVVSPSVYHFIQFVSSAGRASALQAECHRFKSYTNYQGLRFYQVFLTIPAQAKCRKQQERITLNSLEKIDAIPPNVKKKRGKHTKVPKVEME